jgi:predicted RNA-binding protein with EMAP domain
MRSGNFPGRQAERREKVIENLTNKLQAFNDGKIELTEDQVKRIIGEIKSLTSKPPAQLAILTKTKKQRMGARRPSYS